jgi:hypothetical protein
MKLIFCFVFLSLFDPTEAEYFGDCLLLNVTVTLQDKSLVTGWTDEFCFQNGESKREFLNSLKKGNDYLEKIFKLYYYQNELEINPYAIKSNIGWIIPYEEIKRFSKASITSLKVNRIDSATMGCYKITLFSEEDINNITKFNYKNSITINSGDDSFTFYWINSSALNDKLVTETIEKIKNGSAGEDYLSGISRKFLDLGIIIENCRGD